MTQEGAKLTADDPSLTCFSPFSLADGENCVFPLAGRGNRACKTEF